MDRCGGCQGIIWPWQKIEWHRTRFNFNSVPFHVKRYCWNMFPSLAKYKAK